MKIIEAYWEKRNLGVDTYEIQFDVTDVIENVARDFEVIKGEYIVAKVPSDRDDISKYVQKNGFLYMEDLIFVEHDLHDVQRNMLHQRLYDATSYREMSEDDVKQLKEEIHDGMFDVDRISKDDGFGKEISARRYMNWVDDLLNKGARPYVILYKEAAIGFVILEEKQNGIYYSVLGGGYRKYRNSGLGVIQKEQEIVKEIGGKKVVTVVSSNNVSQLKALMLNGYIPNKVEHVFVKHILKDKE